MGNTVSAAENIAAGLVHPIGAPEPAKQHHHPYDKSGVPPPECPMHQKPTNTECPVGYGNVSDINPLNMVSLSLSLLNNLTCVPFI